MFVVPSVLSLRESSTYLGNTDMNDREIAILQMSQAFANLNAKVTVEQIPLARQILREMLNQSSSEADGERLSHWNWLRVMYGRHQGVVPQSFQDFMGPEITADFIGPNKKSFKYEVLIDKAELSVSTPIAELGLAPVGISIEKTRTGTPSSVSISLLGGMAQAGAGFDVTKFIDKFKTNRALRGKYDVPDNITSGDLVNEANPVISGFGAGSGSDRSVVYSEIDYTETILDGPVMLYGMNISGSAFGFNFSAGPSLLILYGNGSAPPFVIPLPLTSSDNSVSL